MSATRQGGLGESSGSDGSEGPDGPDRPTDPVAAIESALAAFRGRGPGGPWGSGPGPFGPSWPGPGAFGRGPGGWGGPPPGAGHDGHGAPFGSHAHHDHGGPRRHGGPGGRGGHAAMRLLMVLARHGPSSVSDLAAAIGVDQPRASRLVQAAVEAGYVRREVDPNDARRSILVITDAGRTALSTVLDHRRSAIERALADFTPAEREEFARLLIRFAEGWMRG